MAESRADRDAARIRELERRIEAYEQAVNRIDDLCEYRYRSMSLYEVRDEVMGHIDGIGERLSGGDDGKP